MRLILPILLALVGLGAGLGAGYFLRPPPEDHAEINPCGDVAAEAATSASQATDDAEPTTHDYVKLNNQFIIPVVEDERVAALVVLSLSLEVTAGGQERIYEREPKIRDSFLQVLFDHANSGGFDGAFTNGRNMTILRDALRESAITTLGPVVTDVLIIDIVRQDT
ncbi:MAG: flagellar basal body-associated FliL family protein [Paracoccaceae bacterium]